MPASQMQVGQQLQETLNGLHWLNLFVQEDQQQSLRQVIDWVPNLLQYNSGTLNGQQRIQGQESGRLQDETDTLQRNEEMLSSTTNFDFSLNYHACELIGSVEDRPRQLQADEVNAPFAQSQHLLPGSGLRDQHADNSPIFPVSSADVCWNAELRTLSPTANSFEPSVPQVR